MAAASVQPAIGRLTSITAVAAGFLLKNRYHYDKPVLSIR
jgi:hypothetical protein